MATEVLMPQMGESIAEGTITRWMAAVGAAVKRDDPLLEISTDKVDTEVPSPAAGTILEILVPEGATVEVGTAMVVIGAVLVGILFGGIPSVIAAYLVDRTDTSTYGPSYAAATFAFGVAQVSSPQIGGLIADWRGSFTLVFAVSATAMTSGALFAWNLPKGS